MIASPHTFHIPVLGIGFSADAPLKVAKYGISSVISLVDDSLLDELRGVWSRRYNRPYTPVEESEFDARARRITEYLNTIKSIIDEQVEHIRNSGFVPGSEIAAYFEMLPDRSPLKLRYLEMQRHTDPESKQRIQNELRSMVVPGSIDVNVMTKLDKVNYDSSRQAMPSIYNDAHAALRGFAMSDLESSVVFSAGMNPRLYGYIATFQDFFPQSDGRRKKNVIIKVSDYRSALIQGKFLAKKGIWVSEFRIESGLNCGGHAFATDGYLLGPILEEFLTHRDELHYSLLEQYLPAIRAKGLEAAADQLNVRVTVQGGVVTVQEQDFLYRRFGVDSVGWGSPFLLVPEVMNVDPDTLQQLSAAHVEDLYLSDVSPLGVPFNNLRSTSKEREKYERIAAGKPGSKCIKKFLSLNTELSEKPLCTASIVFLKRKQAQLQEQFSGGDFEEAYNNAMEKECLCEGLVVSALSVNNLDHPQISKAVSVCPGPNLAYFSHIASLREMVDHIYGRLNLVTDPERPNMFIKELHLYVDYFQRMINESLKPISEKTQGYLKNFSDNIHEGIAYYRKLIPEIREESEQALQRMRVMLDALEQRLGNITAHEAQLNYAQVCAPCK